MITWQEFVIRLIFAFVLGAGIGMERKWHRTRALLRTNVLVSLGTTIFATLAATTSEATIPTTILAQLILAISLICGSIILQKQANFISINNAITLWCAGAIGSLIGFGFFIPAYASTAAIIVANLLFPPLEQILPQNLDEESANRTKSTKQIQQSLEQQSLNQTSKENRYRCQLICPVEDESDVLALLVKSVREQKLMLTAIESKNIEIEDRDSLAQVEVKADFVSEDYKEQLELQQAVSILKSQTRVNTVSWQYLGEN